MSGPATIAVKANNVNVALNGTVNEENSASADNSNDATSKR